MSSLVKYSIYINLLSFESKKIIEKQTKRIEVIGVRRRNRAWETVVVLIHTPLQALKSAAWLHEK